jgi:hypothetical protein
MGRVVHKLPYHTQWTSPRQVFSPMQVFSPTRKYVFDTYSFYCIPDNGASHPMGIEGADQTIFVRSIPPRSAESLFAKPLFRSSENHSTMNQITATIRSVKQGFRGGGTREHSKPASSSVGCL